MQNLRAVIYNRCSTEEEAQKDALVKQVQESRACVQDQGWELVDSYVEAKSGTTARGRKEYNRLYRDLDSDRFDIIVIKSLDRLMRNTKDWYLFLDRMQQGKKRLYMYLENKFYTPEDALITGIKAILAEEYSRELSKKINNAHRNRQKEGKSFVFTNRTYGYKKMPDRRIVVDPKEAEMIKTIFRLSAGGYGTYRSAEILYREGYRNREGRKLSPSQLRNILRNPLYKGTVVQNRLHYDFESKQVCKNPPAEWLLHENAVPRIIEEDLFESANRELDRRRREGKRENPCGRQGEPGRYALSGKLVCGLCGRPYYRTVRRNKGGSVAEWKCSNYLQNGRKTMGACNKRPTGTERQSKAGGEEGCDNIHLLEKKLHEMLERLCDPDARERRQDILLEEILSILQKALGTGGKIDGRENLEASLHKLARQKEVLLDKLLEGVIGDQDFRLKNERLEEERIKLEEELKRVGEGPAKGKVFQERLAVIREKLKAELIGQAQREELMEHIAKIEVFPTHMALYAKPPVSAFLSPRLLSCANKNGGDGLTLLNVEQTCGSARQLLTEGQKEEILCLMKGQPAITAKQIAQRTGQNLSLIRRRICALKAEGKIRYSAIKGGGKWQILVPFLDSRSCHLRSPCQHLASIDDQVTQSPFGGQKFTDDDAHQGQTDIDFHGA